MHYGTEVIRFGKALYFQCYTSEAVVFPLRLMTSDDLKELRRRQNLWRLLEEDSLEVNWPVLLENAVECLTSFCQVEFLCCSVAFNFLMHNLFVTTAVTCTDLRTIGSRCITIV